MMLIKTIRSTIQHRELIWEMAMRDLKALNKGAFLGYLWLIINPLIQVAAYVIIVSFIFKNRLSENSGTFDYALYVLSGMIPWQMITKSLQDSPNLILNKMELVKQVIYPIETLPLTSLIVSSMGVFVSLCVFFILTAVTGEFNWTILLLPIPFFILVVFLLGISWAFSIIAVLIKDLREMVTVALSLLVYLSPVVVSEAMVGEKIWGYILWNPLAHIVICFRDVFNATFHGWSWLIFTSMALTMFFIGAWIILRAKLLINEYI